MKQAEVKVNYSDYSNNPIATDIELSLFKDISLKLKYNEDAKNISLCMSDTISANTELEGELDYEKINDLIRALSQLRNQIKMTL